MLVKSRFTVELEVLFDTESGTMTLVDAAPGELIPIENDAGTMDILFTETMSRYGILTLGGRRAAKLHLPDAGKPLTVVVNDKAYPAKMHKVSPGRVDGLSRAWKENSPFRERRWPMDLPVMITPTFNPQTNELHLAATALPKNDEK